MRASAQDQERPRQGAVVGLVWGHSDGHGWVQRDDGAGEVFLPPEQMQAVLHRDRVQLRVVRNDSRGRAVGHVERIVERTLTQVVGRLDEQNGVWQVQSCDRRCCQAIGVPAPEPELAQAGQVVVARVLGEPQLYVQPQGVVIECLGKVDDPGMEIEIAVRKFDLPHRFGAATLGEAEALPERVLAKDKKGRVDLCDVPLVTIDDEDARDFDDAVYCEPCMVGGASGWRLLVAIADVSHYVRPGMALDGDAFARATSVYFPRRVIPMLPEKLSNDLCSLKPQVERLCLVADMLITPTGGLYGYQFYNAVMRSHARLTYSKVAAALQGAAPQTLAPDPVLLPQLQHLHALSQALQAARVRRGAMDFDSTETRIVWDAHGRIARMEPLVRNDAHRLIEEAMLAANVCAADFLQQHERAALFRVHLGPTPEKHDVLYRYLLGIGFGAGAAVLGRDAAQKTRPEQLQRIGVLAQARSDKQQVHMMLLRAMQQAQYQRDNEGHFGLAYEAYTHFTSPIRRYPDLMVHRAIKAALVKRHYRPKLPVDVPLLMPSWGRQGATRPQDTAAVQPSARQAVLTAHDGWQGAGLHCSACERRADEAARDVLTWLKCKYMESFVGESMLATIQAVTAFGLFAVPQGMYVEGLVHISAMGSDYYRFDEQRQELAGERSGKRWRVGDAMPIRVAAVDAENRRIDFVPDWSYRPADADLDDAATDAQPGARATLGAAKDQRAAKPAAKERSKPSARSKPSKKSSGRTKRSNARNRQDG